MLLIVSREPDPRELAVEICIKMGAGVVLFQRAYHGAAQLYRLRIYCRTVEAAKQLAQEIRTEVEQVTVLLDGGM